MPKLTIGTAHHTDWDGLYFTIQSIRMQFPHLMPDTEFVIIDNSPTNRAHAEKIHGLVANANRGTAGCRYIEMATPVGTSPSRNKIFEVATGEYVLVLDCHVLLVPGALDSLMQFYRDNPNSQDILSGPLIYDDLINTHSTHFDDTWRSEMWGTWGVARKCSCGPDGVRFSVMDTSGGHAAYRALGMGVYIVERCNACGKKIPNLMYAGHERHLDDAGFTSQGHGTEPFEIPGQGLGLFSCRKDAWLGFHPEARAFGGEELYIHEKFRQAGHKALCIPGLKWLHRFGRVGGVPYPIDRWNKVRNYVLEFKELGRDMTPIYNHFVKGGYFGEDAWNQLVAAPDKFTSEAVYNATPQIEKVGSMRYPNLDELFNATARKPRDLNEHMATFRKWTRDEITGKQFRVVELSTRQESTIAFLAGQPESLVSFNPEVTADVQEALQFLNGSVKYDLRTLPAKGEIAEDLPECDVLFVDTYHNYAQATLELNAYASKVSRAIIFHDTQIYGATGDDSNSPGLTGAIEGFVKRNPEWFVAFFTPTQYGLTVLSKDPVDHVLLPGTALKNILSQLGINSAPSCDCNARAAQMDSWGVDGCREHFDEIVTWIRENQERWGWKSFLSAGLKALTSGIALRLNVLDPIPSLINLAIDTAAAVRKNREKLIAERKSQLATEWEDEITTEGDDE